MSRPFMRGPPVLPSTLSQSDVNQISSYLQNSNEFLEIEYPEETEQAAHHYIPIEKIYNPEVTSLKKNNRRFKSTLQPSENDERSRSIFHQEQDYQMMPSWPQGWDIEDEAALSLYRDGSGDVKLPPVDFDDVVGSVFGQPHHQPPKPPIKKKKNQQSINLKSNCENGLLEKKDNTEKNEIKSKSGVFVNKKTRLLQAVKEEQGIGCYPTLEGAMDIRDMCCSLSRAEALSKGLPGPVEDDSDLRVSAHHLSLVLRLIEATGDTEGSQVHETLQVLDSVVSCSTPLHNHNDFTKSALAGPSFFSSLSSSKSKLSNINAPISAPTLVRSNSQSSVSPQGQYVLVAPFLENGELIFVDTARNEDIQKPTKPLSMLTRKRSVDLDLDNDFDNHDEPLSACSSSSSGIVSSITATSSTATSLPLKLRLEAVTNRRDASQSVLARRAKKQICYTFRRKLSAVKWLKNWLLRAKAKEFLEEIGQNALNMMKIHKEKRRWLRAKYLSAGETKQAAQLIAAAARQRTLRAACDYHHLAAMQREHRIQVGSSSGLTEAFSIQHRALLVKPHRHACFLWKLITLRCKALKVMKVRKKANKFLIKLQRKKFLQIRARGFKLLQRFSIGMVLPLQNDRRSAVERLGIEMRHRCVHYSRDNRNGVREGLTKLGRKVVATRNARFKAYNWLNKVGKWSNSKQWNEALSWLCGKGNLENVKNYMSNINDFESNIITKNSYCNKQHIVTEMYDIKSKHFISYDQQTLKIKLIENGYINYGGGKLEEYLSKLICFSEKSYDNWYEISKNGKLGLGGILRLHSLHQRKDKYILQLNVQKQINVAELREGATVNLSSLSKFVLTRWGISGPFGSSPGSYPLGLPSLRPSFQQKLNANSSRLLKQKSLTLQEKKEMSLGLTKQGSLSLVSKGNPLHAMTGGGIGEGAGGEVGIARTFLRKKAAAAAEHYRAQNTARIELASAIEFAEVERQIFRLQLDPQIAPLLKTLEKEVWEEDMVRAAARCRSVEEATTFEIEAAFEMLDLDGSGEIDLVEFSFMMRSLAINNMDLLIELGFPLPGDRGNKTRGRNGFSALNSKDEGGNDAYVWRMRSFKAMDRDNSGGVSCNELASWLIHELKIGKNEEEDVNMHNLHLQEMNRPKSPATSSPAGGGGGSNPTRRASRRRSSMEIIFTPLIKANDLVTLSTRAGRLFLQRYQYDGEEWTRVPPTPKISPLSPTSPVKKRPMSPSSPQFTPRFGTQKSITE